MTTFTFTLKEKNHLPTMSAVTVLFPWSINNDGVINIQDEIKVIKNLAIEYDPGSKGRNSVPTVQIFKASQYKIFDNAIAIVFSPKF